MTTVPNLNPIPVVTGDDLLISHDITTNRSGRIAASVLKDYISDQIISDGDITADNTPYKTAFVADYLDRAIITVATYIDLLSTSGVIGDKVSTIGHTFAGLGGGEYLAVSASGKITNGGTIAVSGSIAWKLTSEPSVLSFGAKADGIANDFNAAKAMADALDYVYFPNIEDSGTTYKLDYSLPTSFDDILFEADEGVVLSFSNNAPYSLYKNIKLKNDINVFFRDINVPYVFPKSLPDTTKLDFKYPELRSESKLYPLDATNNRSVYVLECGYLSSDTFTDSASTRFFDSVNITATGAGTMRGCFIDLGANETVSAYFNDGVTTGPIGVVIRGTSGYTTVISNADNNYFVGSKPIGGSAVGPTASLSWAPLGQGQYTSFRAENSYWSVSRVDSTRCVIRLNGQVLTQPYIQNVGDILQVGFVYVGNTSPVTISGLCVERNTSGLVSNQRLESIHIFGDSTAETFPGSWDSKLRNILDTRYGLKIMSIVNHAIAGETLEQQYNRMLSEGFGNSYFVVICVGTNNIQSLQSLTTFKTNFTTMVNYVKSNGRVPIVIVPWIWYTQAQTGGIGQASSQYDKGAPYRMIMERVCAETGVYCVKPTDVLPNPSPNYIFTDPTTRLLRDNIHQDAIGYQLYAEMVANALVSNYLKTPEVVEQTLPVSSYKNSATSPDFRVAVTKDGMCSLGGTFNVSVITDGASIVDLPRFARPSRDVNFPVLCFNSSLAVVGQGYVFVGANGDFKLYKIPATTTVVILSGISYKIAYA